MGICFVLYYDQYLSHLNLLILQRYIFYGTLAKWRVPVIDFS